MKHRTLAVPAPPGTPFHHLASAGLASLRVFAAILAGVAGVIAVTQIPDLAVLSMSWTSHGIPAMPLYCPETGVMSWQAETALALTLLLTGVLLISGTRLRTILSVTGRVRWPWLRTCTLTAFAAVLSVLAFAGYGVPLLRYPGGRVIFPDRPTTGELLLAAALVALAAVYAIALELLFRGWYLQAFGVEQPAWWAIAGQAVICTLSPYRVRRCGVTPTWPCIRLSLGG